MRKQRLKTCYVAENPPWADRAIRANVARIKRAFGAGALPAVVDGKKYTELGCGHYGCVYKTNLKGKVLKLTSDPTEISLVNFILNSDDVDETSGIVRYYGLMDLKDTHRDRQVFAILREEAYNIGLLADSRADWARKKMVAKLNTFLTFGRIVRDMYKKHGHKPGFDEDAELALDRYGDGRELSEKIPAWIKSAERAGYALAGCKAAVEELSQTPDIYTVGETLGWFLCKGKLLADVHLQNIGQVVRPDNYDEPIMAITDPGHAIDVIPVWTYLCS